MDNKLKKDLAVAWNEIEEAITSIKELSDKDLIKHKQDILNRLQISLNLVGEYVSDEDIIELNKN